MKKACLQKENIYQNLTHKASLFLSPPQPFHTVESQLTETHNLNRNEYRYMDLCVGPYEIKVERSISGEEYPIRDILMSDLEWGGPQRCKKYGTKTEYAQNVPLYFSALEDKSFCTILRPFLLLLPDGGIVQGGLCMGGGLLIVPLWYQLGRKG